MEWYYASDAGEQIGPATEDQIKKLIDDGQVTSSTPVWNDTMEDWQDLSTTALASLVKKGPPPLKEFKATPSKKPAEKSYGANTLSPLAAFCILGLLGLGPFAGGGFLVFMAIFLVMLAVFGIWHLFNHQSGKKSD